MMLTLSHVGIEQSFKDGSWADESNFEVKGASTLSNVYVTEAPRRARENRALLVRGAACTLPHLLICCLQGCHSSYSHDNTSNHSSVFHVCVTNLFSNHLRVSFLCSNLLQNPSLFDGCDFYFVGLSVSSTSPSRDELVGLITAAGGRILSREPRVEPKEEGEVKGGPPRQCPFHGALSSDLKGINTFVLYDPCSLEESSKLISKWRHHRTTVTVPIAWILDCLTYFELKPLPKL